MELRDIEMKVLIEENDDIKYPCLMRNMYNGRIVLFSKDRVGVVLYSGSSPLPVGYYSDSWEMHIFEPFKGRLILEN